MIPFGDIFKDGVDGTMIDLWQQCKRKFYYRIVCGYDVKEVAPPLSFGSSVHKALEGYLDKDRLLTPEQSIKVFEDDYIDRGLDSRRTTEKGIRLLKEYFAVFPRETDLCEILEVETPFKMDIGAPVPFSGRPDALIKKGNGTIWVRDYKTTTSYGDTYREQFDMHSAIDGYMLNTMRRFGSCEGTQINVLVTYAASKPKVERFDVTRTREQLEFWREDVVRIIRDMVSFVELFYDDKHAFNLSRARCKDYNSKCMFYDVCQFCDNQSLIKGEYVENRWSPFTVGEKK